VRRVRGSFKGSFKLGRYPYTYARVMAMKSKLLKLRDYERLMKLSLDGLIKFLHDTDYKKEVQKFGIRHSGLQLLELALQENLARTYRKLRSISPPELGMLLDIHLHRRDMVDIKTIIRGVNAGLPIEKIRSLIYPVHFTEEQYMKLISSPSVEDVLRQLSFIPFEAFNDALSYYGRTKSLSLIETVLDQNLYLGMLKTLKALPSQVKVLRRFLLLEIDLLNVMAILRLKLAGISSEEVSKIVMFKGGRLDSAFLKDMVNADMVPAIQLLKGSPYGHLFTLIDEERPNLTQVEIILERFKLKQSTQFLHHQPLTAEVILGFLFAKKVEVRNLLLLGKASELGLKEDFVKNNLVI